jgi:hypothetical protein
VEFTTDWLAPEFTTPTAVLALALVGYLLVIEPWYGRRLYARLARDREHDAGALPRFYRQTLAIEWSWTLVVVLIVLLAPGIKFSDLGLAWPDGSDILYSVSLASFIVIQELGVNLELRRRAAAGQSVPARPDVDAMLPGTSAERRMALAVAVTTATCEELVYRGLFIAVGVGLFGLPGIVAAVVATVFFGLCYLRQGWRGVFGATALGAMMMILYLGSASLLLPILVQVVVAIRDLLLVPAPSHPGRH